MPKRPAAKHESPLDSQKIAASNDDHDDATRSAKSKASKTETSKHTRFHLVRSLGIADFITLGNAACGTAAIFFCLNYLENDGYDPYLVCAFTLFPIALLFDMLDGAVARIEHIVPASPRKIHFSSPYGKDLDSLSDVISFSVAPAVLAFTLGMRGVWDCVCLSFFVCCGIGRLARYNVTSPKMMLGGIKVKYYEGFPVPTGLSLVLLLAYCYNIGAVGKELWFGIYRFQIGSLYLGSFHPWCLLFMLFGCLMVSVVKIPKP